MGMEHVAGEFLSVDNQTTQLRLLTSLDREKFHMPVVFSVTCTLQNAIYQRNLSLVVGDVNDNAPHFAKRGGYRKQFLERDISFADVSY